MGWIKRYIKEVRGDFVIEPDQGHVFLETTGQALDPDKLSRIVMKYIKQADMGKSGSCHLFRHTVATLMQRHVSIGTTDEYV